jgi:hypothetical protein
VFLCQDETTQTAQLATEANVIRCAARSARRYSADRSSIPFDAIADGATLLPMSIELFAFDTPNGRKISMALEEMALPYSVRIVDIRKDEQFDPEFVKISPNAKIPAIVDHEGPEGTPVSIFESGAILLYLGEKTGKFLRDR